MAISQHPTQAGDLKNGIIFYHYVYENPSTRAAIREARRAVNLCVSSSLLDLTEAALCVVENFELGVLRGFGIVPDLRNYLQQNGAGSAVGEGYTVGLAFSSGGVFTFPVRQARRQESTGRVLIGPPLRVMFLLPQVLQSRH